MINSDMFKLGSLQIARDSSEVVDFQHILKQFSELHVGFGNDSMSQPTHCKHPIFNLFICVRFLLCSPGWSQTHNSLALAPKSWDIQVYANDPAVVYPVLI